MSLSILFQSFSDILMCHFCSVWHVSIYTSSFLFLCSKAAAVNCENEQPQSENYELARQNSFSGNNERDGR